MTSVKNPNIFSMSCVTHELMNRAANLIGKTTKTTTQKNMGFDITPIYHFVVGAHVLVDVKTQLA